MKKLFLITMIIILGILMSSNFIFARIEKDTDQDGLSDFEEQTVYFTDIVNPDTDGDGYADGHEVYFGYSPLHGKNIKLSRVSLAVPYIKEAPDDNWVGPWKNACEEASIAMVESFYKGEREINVPATKNFMMALFNEQNRLYGSNADADAKRTVALINKYTSFNAYIKTNPTIDELKKQLYERHPVISLHYGYELKNKNIPFVPTGSYYHMMVITGYDNQTGNFITNDPGDRFEGKAHAYEYNLFMKSLADFNFAERKANGPATVIFTFPKLARSIDYHRIYYIDSNSKQYVTHPQIFGLNNWTFASVCIEPIQWLNKFKNEPDLTI